VPWAAYGTFSMLELFTNPSAKRSPDPVRPAAIFLRQPQGRPQCRRRAQDAPRDDGAWRRFVEPPRRGRLGGTHGEAELEDTVAAMRIRCAC